MLTETDKLIHGAYDSVTELMESVTLDHTPRDSSNKSELDEVYKRRDADWYGLPNPGKNQAEVCKMFADGWDYGARQVQEMLDTMPRIVLPDIRRKLIWADNGDSVDMDRVRAGRLDQAFRRPKRNGKGVPRISLWADIGGNYNVEASELFWRGAAMCALGAALVKSGYSVELRCGCYIDTHQEKSMLYTACIKPYTTPFTLPDLAAAVSPAMFRAVGIAWIYKYAPFGLPGAGHHQDLEQVKGLKIIGAHYGAIATSAVKNKAAAIDWVQRHATAIQGLKLDAGAARLAA